MNNQLILDQFDIVISLTENTINQELLKLYTLGTIKKEVVLYRVLNAQNVYEYTAANTATDIPAGTEFIDGIIIPSIGITQTGTTVVFKLNFVSGNASFTDKNGFGPLATLKSYDMTGWKYGFSVNLDLTTFKQDGSKSVPDLVEQELNNFTANDLAISCLFLDFVSADLKSTIPAYTACPAEMTEFMSFYFEHVATSGNPYILGYSASVNTQSSFAKGIPAELLPAGATFTLYNDKVNEGISNLNYTIATHGGHGAIHGAAPTLDTNWFTPSNTAAGKMIISHQCLLEDLILIPFFNNLQQQTAVQVSRTMGIGNPIPYNVNKSAGNHWSFNVASTGDDDNNYNNTFTVDIQNANNQVNLIFNGRLTVNAENSKNMFFCTARAYANATVTWSGVVSISIVNGELQLNKSFGQPQSNVGYSKNGCGDFFGGLASVFGSILDVFTGWTGLGFSNLLTGAFDISLPNIGGLSIGLNNFSSSIKQVLITPTGGKFAPISSPVSPSLDNKGNLYLDININQ